MSISIVDKALAWSGALRRQAQGNPDFINWLGANASQPVDRSQINSWFKEFSNSDPSQSCLSIELCRKVLRDLRKRVFFLTMVRDLADLASLEEVTQAMTYLAEISVEQTYRSVCADLVSHHGEPIDPLSGLPQEMVIVGMGKLGGCELNVSSDIDLIMLYGEEGETQGPKVISNHEFYSKLTRRMMPVLSEADGDGQVFRTDLRLRPDGDSGALAWSLNAFEQYLFTQGREWERYAWLKARILPAQSFKNSDTRETLRLIEAMRLPFVYRKYFDFDALAALRGLRERIRQDWERRALARKGTEADLNIKLGDGGIREIEFVVQLSQLIRGGRIANLRERGLLKALAAQQTAGLISVQTGSELAHAYRFLRKVEHVLQYREDAQTHVLPQTPELQSALASAMGETQGQFEAKLKGYRDFVSSVFHDAFRIAGLAHADARETNPTTSTQKTTKLESPKVTVNLLDKIQESKDLSLAENTELALERALNLFTLDQDNVRNRVTRFLDSPRIRAASNQSRGRLDTLLPKALSAASEAKNPVKTAFGTLDLLETIVQRSAYLALLAEYPDTLIRVTRMIDASPWAAHYLVRHPLVLDSLISWSGLMETINFQHIARQLQQDLDACILANGQPDIELQMNLMRDLQHQISFQLLAQDLEAQLTVEQLADQLSALADLMLSEALRRVWPLVLGAHTSQSPIEPKFAIIAYGKLGGKEFGYSSDLDLVYIYDDNRDEAAQQYTKLGQRLTSWLSTMTSSGRLYEVDLRLRPDGDAGLLAVSIEAFEEYQLKHAWVWEHQALTRARFSAGDREVGQKFEVARRKILVQARCEATLREEIIEMRQKIIAGHPNKSALFDIKHDQGGMVDLEFVTQYLVLRYAGSHPELLENLGNIALLNLAAKAGLIPPSLANQAANAYRALRHSQHLLRLQGAEKARIAQGDLIAEREVIQALWRYVFMTNQA
jgi:glutamate-ammonia-ligase adenylyltransferase